MDPGSLEDLLAKAAPPKYIAILGYVTPSEEYDAAVTELRAALRERTKCTTTFGYGPRYLHSTGQYHKGGPRERPVHPALPARRRRTWRYPRPATRSST